MEHDALESIRIQALNEISLLQDDINAKQFEINELKERQKKLRSVVKAASDKPEQTNSRPKKPASIRDVTRMKVISLIKSVDREEFTVPQLVAKAGPGGEMYENLAESTIARALNVMREEGYVRQIGVEGRAPVYKWVGE